MEQTQRSDSEREPSLKRFDAIARRKWRVTTPRSRSARADRCTYNEIGPALVVLHVSAEFAM